MSDTLKERQKKAWKKYRSGDKYKRTYFNNHLKRKYNMTIEEYETRLLAQNNQCKICLSSVSLREWKDGRVQRIPLFVDHCHTTGVVRGLLCNKCNVGLAMFNDSPDIMVSAITYLRENQNF